MGYAMDYTLLFGFFLNLAKFYHIFSESGRKERKPMRNWLEKIPVTFCKGLFNYVHRKFIFQGKK
jgi:hypothetical protein